MFREEEVVVSAAIQIGGLIITGVRHFDKIMQLQLEVSGLDRKGCKQGFVTNKMRFVERDEAWEMAKKTINCGGAKAATG